MEFILPNLGENIESVRVAAILVGIGDTVEADQNVLELETDKAMMELPAPAAGKIEELLIKEGDDVTIGQKLMVIAAIGATEAATPPATETAPAAETPAPVAATPEPAVASDPAMVTPPTPASTPPVAYSGAKVPASPSVRRFAREIGIDISVVPGSGAHGRISTEDVKAYAKKINTQWADIFEPGALATPGLPPLPDFSQWGEVKRESMSPVRLKTARQMQLCWSQIPHVTQFNHADITELEKLRKLYAKKAEAVGGKLTMAVMLVKVVAAALKNYPKFNASLDMEAKEIVYKDFVNIGIAVNTPRGLIVPVMRDVDKKNMIEISSEVMQIAEKARTGKITMNDLSGSTFTITNLGSIGGTYFTPIVNFPEVSILGMGRAFLQADPGGASEPRMVLPLSLSYDHRVIDGAEGATFLKWVVDAIEQPLLLSLEG